MLKGKKVVLRSFKEDDAASLHELKQDIESYKAFLGYPFPSNIDSEKEWINKMYPPGLRDSVYLAIEIIKTGKFGGYCVARNINYLNKTSEIGIIFTKDVRGKGYFIEISFLFYHYLFNQLNIQKVFSLVLEENKDSITSSLKLGFKEEGFLKNHIFQDGIYKNVFFISLFNNEFYQNFKKNFELYNYLLENKS